MIQVSHLSKVYGEKHAVRDISFTVNRGEVVGFLGRNGAGKTTVMNIITGYISSTEGSVTVDGYDILQEPLKVKQKIGYLPEHPPLYLDMTIFDYLQFACEIKKFPKKKRTEHIQQICALVGIADVQGRLIRNMSKGYRQRIGIAQALIGNPEVLIFDEPTIGLDPRQIIDIRKLIKDLGKEHTVILSSHILPEIADICERVIIIDKGQLVVQDTLMNLARGVGENFRIMVRLATEDKNIKKLLHELPGVKKADVVGCMEPGTLDFLVEADKNQDIRETIFEAVVKAGHTLLMLKPVGVTLEDIFLRLTGGHDKEGS